MKKSLIALLVATLPAAAFADVTIYGKIKGGIEAVDDGYTKQTNFDDLGSRIGFKGSEDLGNGLKAIWQVETGLNIDDGADYKGGSLANRNSFIGLQGNWGTVRLGNVTNFLDSDMGIIDAWEYESNALGLGIFTRDADRLKNSIRYDLPTIVPGLTAALQYGTRENRQRPMIETYDPATNTKTWSYDKDSDRETFALGLGYENSGFFGKYNYTHTSPSNAVGITDIKEVVYSTNTDKHRLELGYSANNWLVAFAFQQNKGASDAVGSDWASLYGGSRVGTVWVLDNKGQVNNCAVGNTADGFHPCAGDKLKTTEYALTVAYTFGALTPKFSYVHGNDVKLGGAKLLDSSYDQYVLGLDYALSKRTVLGAQYGQISLKDTNFYNAAGTTRIGTIERKDLKAFGLNVVHSF